MEIQKKLVMDKSEYIFGTRAVLEAIHNGRTIDKILIKKGQINELIRQLTTLAKENEIAVQFVPVEKINRITRKNHQGVLALLSPIEFANIDMLLPGIFESGETPLILILDGITDVRNFGAIVRSAECAGVHAIIIPGKGMARIGADALKTSAGALHYVPVCKTDDLLQSIKLMIDSGIHIVAATEKAEKPYTESDFSGPLGIIMGSEEKGIGSNLLSAAHEHLQIPLKGKIGSLNVSVSAALMVYEAIRQRG